MNLRYTPQAMLDLQEIEDYISVELQSPDAARHIITSIARRDAVMKGGMKKLYVNERELRLLAFDGCIIGPQP